jgi:hypothetical protein
MAFSQFNAGEKVENLALLDYEDRILENACADARHESAEVRVTLLHWRCRTLARLIEAHLSPKAESHRWRGGLSDPAILPPVGKENV